MDIVAGLVIIAVLYLLIWGIFKGSLWLCEVEYDLRDFLQNPRGKPLWKLAAFIIWVPIMLYVLIVAIIGAICGVMLIKDAHQWLNEPKK